MNIFGSLCDDSCVIRWCSPKAEIEGLFSVENSSFLQEIFDEQGLELGDEIHPSGNLAKWSRSISRKWFQI